MNALGLELLDAAVVAVIVDESGRVVARADAADPSPALALTAALSRLSPSLPAQVGVASANPEASSAVAAMTALASRLPALKGALPSGLAAALAEAWLGVARGANDVVYFGIAEHATAGILRSGAPMTGSRGRAASAAWLALNPVEREDYRKIGCLEAEVAASGIVRRLIWRIKSGDQSRVADAVNGDFAAVTVDHVLDAARDGDGVSVSVMRDTAKYLGMAAANLVVIADPEVLVLGGIMATAADLLLDAVRTEIARRLPGAMMQDLDVRSAQLGGDAPAIGAARSAMTST